MRTADVLKDWIGLPLVGAALGAVAAGIPLYLFKNAILLMIAIGKLGAFLFENREALDIPFLVLGAICGYVGWILKTIRDRRSIIQHPRSP